MNPALSDWNFRPTFTALASPFAELTGVAVLGQMEQGHAGVGVLVRVAVAVPGVGLLVAVGWCRSAMLVHWRGRF